MVEENEVRIEDILGEIRTVMLSIPCPYCAKVPSKPVKPGMVIKCSACGSFYTIEKTLNETSEEVLRKIVDQVLKKYIGELEDLRRKVASEFISYAEETLRGIRVLYEERKELPTKSEIEELLLNLTNRTMNTIASRIEEVRKTLVKGHERIELKIDRVGNQVTSIKGLLESFINIFKRLPGPVLPGLIQLREVRLTYEDDEGQIREISLSRGEITIGRDPDGFEIQVRTPKEILNLGIFDSTVSREHLKIVFDGKVIYVEDLYSRNGTYINNKRLNAGERYLVKDGDEIKLGALLKKPTKFTVKFLYQ